MKRQKQPRFLPAVEVLLLAGVIIWFSVALAEVQDSATRQGRQQLEDALRRAAVACYAAEGRYPPNAEYLAEHYGVQINEKRYAVFYEVAGENLMPQITVVERS